MKRVNTQWWSPRRGSPAIQLCIALGFFLVTALPVEAGHVPAREVGLFRAVNGLPDLLYFPVWLLMQFGQLLAVPATVVVALLARRLRLALDLAVAGLAAYVLAKVVKETIERGRPGQLLEEVILRHAPAIGHGFVAGHAATAVALATVASPYLGRPLRVISWSIAGVVCLGRVYVGAHLPLDVLGGAALGWAIGSLVHLALGAPEPRA